MKKKKTLAVLQHIKVTSPCHESWESMGGDDRRRHCEKCNQSVTNLSSLSAQKAAKLIRDKAKSGLCVRYHLNNQGEIIFRSRFDSAYQIWRTATLCVATLLTLFGLSQSAAADCADDKKSAAECNAGPVMMGGIKAENSSPTQEASATPAAPVIMGELGPTPAPHENSSGTEKK